MSAAATDHVEFSGLKGRFFAWFLTSPMRRVLEWKMGKPDARIMELLELEGGERVLDAGSGSGFHTLMAAERLTDGEILAVDVSEEMLARLTRNAKARGLAARVQTLRGDCMALAVPDASMDRAVSSATWHHLADPQKACDEMVRALRPGGRAVVCDLQIGDGEKVVRAMDGHDRAFGPERLRAIFERAGLGEIHVETIGRWVIGAGVKLA